ncbi:MerR family transcriptional regulator [Kocuria turfanensis]|uniref:MerR family transcriptional regulator n=1 Tax=Kocuria turfanensis TaxID=388357 RepID=UPI0040359861
MRTGERLTVGQVAERFGVTVRTLHHYDDVGLLRPSERSAGGYRLYTEEDLLRLRHVVVYRRLGLPPESHRALGDMYVADPRFTRTYEDLAPGLAQYVRDAIHANADRAGD